MAGIRDDSSGDYGQWLNPPEQSWLDYLKMKGSDVGEGAYNALANITGSLSPIGTSEQGNMALQVPPMVSGLVDSAKRIGERGGFTRVEEFDAPLKQDLANALLTFYGGNALSGLTRPKAIPHSMSYAEQWSATPAAERSMLHPGMEAGIRKLMGHGEYSTSPQVRDRAHGLADNIKQYEAEIAKDPTNAEIYTPLIQDAYRAIQLYADDAATDGILKTRGVSDGAIAMGKRLLSDNKPSILGAALATAGEQSPILNRIPDNLGEFIPPADSFQPRGVYKMNDLEALLYPKVMNAPGTQRMRGGEMVEVPPLNDLATASEALSPYDISALDKAWRNKTKQTGELFSRGVPLPPQQDDNLPPWLKF